MSDSELREHLDSRFDNVDKRLDRVESKLDDHLSRLSTAEASIEWLKGHVKLVTTMGISILGFALAALYQYIVR